MAPDTSRVDFDQKSQLEQILPWILPDEQLWAVYDCKGVGTGFVAFTNKRLLFYDKVFMLKRKALTTLPYRPVTSVSTIDEGRGPLGCRQQARRHHRQPLLVLRIPWRPRLQRAYQTIVREMLQSEP